MTNKTNNENQTSKLKIDNSPNSLGNYALKRVVYVISGAVLATITGFVGFWCHKSENKEDLKQKEKAYDLRNQKAVELKRMISAIDKNPLPGDTTIQTPKTFDQMTSRPMAEESGWLLPWYAKRGQISGCVAGADLGKTILMIDSALAATKGESPTFLPEGAPKADKMDVVFYRLEVRSGEMRERYGDGSVFPANFGWITKGDMASPTFDGLLADIAKRAESFERDTAVFVDPLSKLKNWDLAKFLTAMEEVQDNCAARGIVVSVLFSAHTEETKPWKPLTPDMVRGGDVVIQQVGALFALRRERAGNGFRFLQTLKVPKGEEEKGLVNVIRFEGRKEDQPGSYTHLEYVCQKKESEALPLKPKAEKKVEEVEPEKPKRTGKLAGKEEEIRAMKAAGKSVLEIAKHFEVSKQAIYGVLNKS